ncbi:MAG: hypothetical protein ACI8X5_002175 [Planctomycetota bacterium]|jgi:hypothetical protein
MKLLCSAALLVASFFLNDSPVLAQERSTLVLEGDIVPGVGAVTNVLKLETNDAGDWLVLAGTDHSDPEQDVVVLRNGAVYLREGQTFSSPAGATIVTFDSMPLNSNGNTSHNFNFNELTQPLSFGVYWNSQPLLGTGDLVGAPGFSPGTPYVAFFETLINASETILISASVDDPAIHSAADGVLILAKTDGAGNLISETVVAKTGDLAGSSGIPISYFGAPVSSFGFNDAGEVLYVAQLLSCSGGQHAGINLDGALIAEEGAPSPVAGRNWEFYGTPEVGLNNHGDWVISGCLSGDASTNDIIVSNSGVVVQKGDTLSGMNGMPFTDLGIGPVDIADNGNILCYGAWGDPATGLEKGLWINQTLIVQAGVTMIDGQVLQTIYGYEGGYQLDPSGRYVTFKGNLASGPKGVFRVDLTGPGSSYCFGDGSTVICPCGNNAATGDGCKNWTGDGARLTSLGTASVLGKNIAFHVSQVAANKPCLLFSGNSTNNAAFGDGILCVTGGIARHEVSVADGNGEASWGPGAIANANWSNGDTKNFQV